MTFDEQAATLDRNGVVELLVTNQELTARVDTLTRQVEWFKQQVFGSKSERRSPVPDGHQPSLGEWVQADAQPDEATVTIAEHRRRRGTEPSDEGVDEGGLRFDESVPIEEIHIPSPTPAADDEVVSVKTTYKLAQRPASYVILKYMREVVKKREDGTLSCPPAPSTVLGKSFADVSLLAGVLIDKFRYHLPLYRQHQRMDAAGIHLARSTLTGLVHRTADLLQPIYAAQLASVLKSRVLTMDETPIKAGRKGHGGMKTAYF